MSTIGRLNYKIMADTTGFAKAILASRSEIALMKKVMAETQPAAERVQNAIDKLQAAVDKGTDPNGAYTATIAKLRQDMPPAGTTVEEFREHVQAQAAAAREAAAVIQGLATETETYRAQVKRLVELQKLGLLTDEQVRAEKKRLANELPKVKAQQKALNDEMERVKQLKANAIGPLGQYREAVAGLLPLLRAGKISKAEYAANVRLLRSEMLGSVPVVGQLFRLFAQHPVLLAAAGAAAALHQAMQLLRSGIQAVAGQLRELDELKNQATQLGLPVQEWVHLARAAERADMDTRGLANAMFELQKRIAQAKPVTDAGRQAMRELMAATPVTQLLDTVDAIRQLPSPAAQAAKAVEMFGKAGKDVLPIIRMTAAEFAEWRGELEKPAKLTAADLTAVAAANDALRDMRRSWKNIADVLAVELAPWITEITTDIKQWLAERENIDTLRGIVGLLGTAFRQVAMQVGRITAGAQALSAGLLVVEAAGRGVYAGLLRVREAWNRLTGDAAEADAIRVQIDMQDSMASARLDVALDEFREVYRKAGGQAADAWSTGLEQRVAARRVKNAQDAAEKARQQMQAGSSAGDDAAFELATSIADLVEKLREERDAFGLTGTAVDFYRLQKQGATDTDLAAAKAIAAEIEQHKARAALQQEVTRTTAALREQIATAGMSEDQIQLWRLAQQGATPDTLAHVEALQEQAGALKEQQKAMADAKERQKAMFEDGKRLIEQHRPPLDKFRDRMADLARLYRVGAIDAGTFHRAQQEDIKNTLEQIRVKNELVGANDAISKGSREDIALNRANDRSRREIVADPYRRNLEAIAGDATRRALATPPAQTGLSEPAKADRVINLLAQIARSLGRTLVEATTIEM